MNPRIHEHKSPEETKKALDELTKRNPSRKYGIVHIGNTYEIIESVRTSDYARREYEQESKRNQFRVGDIAVYSPSKEELERMRSKGILEENEDLELKVGAEVKVLEVEGPDITVKLPEGAHYQGDPIDSLKFRHSLFKKKINVEKLRRVEEEIRKLVEARPELPFNAYMGLIMRKVKDEVTGREVAEILRQYVD